MLPKKKKKTFELINVKVSGYTIISKLPSSENQNFWLS